MKRLCVLLLLFFTIIDLYAPSIKKNNTNEILEFLESQKFERKKKIIVIATMLKEMPRNEWQAQEAIKRESAVGLLQEHPEIVIACNEILGRFKYYLSDRKDSTLAVEMYHVYMSRHNPTYDYQKAAYLWNGGEGYKFANFRQKKRLDNYWSDLQHYIRIAEAMVN